MFDLLLKDGLIIEGTDREPYTGDIGIKGDKICELGLIVDRKARKVINCKGKIVVPGFIDVHCHDEIELLKQSTVEPKLRQGVTTLVNGNCSMGFYPVVEKNKNLLLDYNAKLFSLDGISIDWSDYAGYNTLIKKRGINMNSVSLMGHGALRIAVMGFAERIPTSYELGEMKELLIEGISQGIFGMSSGLLYPPSSYADKEEMIQLCRILAENDLVYATHMRNESDNIINSIKENIEIAQKTGVSIEISHLNVSGRGNWGKSEKILHMIEKARRAGLDISCDQYPYKAGSTFLSACFPQWTLNQGIKSLLKRITDNTDDIRNRIKYDILKGIKGWDNIIKSSGWENVVVNSVKTEGNNDITGKSLNEISKLWGLDRFETLFKLFIEEEGNVTILIYSVCEEDFNNIFISDFVMVGTDGIKMGGKPHPRLYGSYPRIIKELIKEKKLISLKEGIKKMTYLPAQKIGLAGRGTLKSGNYADLVIFDYDNIKDMATYAKPRQYPEGIGIVLVNGKIAFDGKEINNYNCGRVLKSKTGP